MLYGEARGNAAEARRLYALRYPGCVLPNRHTFQSTVQHLRDHGSFKPQAQDRGRARPQGVAKLEEDILDAVAVRLDTSTRRHEAGFTKEGVFNAHNTHVWADENPHAVREHNFQHEFSLNVWAGILNGQLIASCILPPRLNAAQYLHFLRDVLFTLLDDINLEIRQILWFLHDGAPCHNAHVIRNWLNFPQRWIGTYGPVAWPARSPDLNPCDFFLWGYMKELVYAALIDTTEQLKDRIETAAETIRNN
ncbi:DDE 3 domain containing protein [Asbolus verrucosus]|uniref:DDE 3 domain containing protein n=1 Tax=Asbolus verrucosus TaxID=1661398 RepID=A0A482WDN0_ASBVE|nr:DDE 3 domain containing protein [Asbolus verrucosus]